MENYKYNNNFPYSLSNMSYNEIQNEGQTNNIINKNNITIIIRIIIILIITTII